MKIIIDDKIPYIKGALEPFADVVYLPGKETTAEVVRDADALLTRTRTICDEKLLTGSSVKFIASATIGFDHIDTEYCKKAGIEWVNAPGCNAESVNQYIASALFSYSLKKGIALEGKTIGIVGVGHVGLRVARFCETIGMTVLLNDPPRERSEGKEKFVTLENIRSNADIITFHVPLNYNGPDKTFHMADRSFLEGLKKRPLLINSCRGEVFDSEAILYARKAGIISGLILDCWENEPEIDPDLLNLCDYGTPHIAGYSRDGKANGTRMSVQAVSRFFNLGIDDWEPSGVEFPENTLIEIEGIQRNEQAIIAEAILSTYKIDADDESLRKSLHLFEKLRGEYPVRREFDCYTLKADNVKEKTLEKLRKIGFSAETDGD